MDQLIYRFHTLHVATEGVFSGSWDRDSFEATAVTIHTRQRDQQCKGMLHMSPETTNSSAQRKSSDQAIKHSGHSKLKDQHRKGDDKAHPVEDLCFSEGNQPRRQTTTRLSRDGINHVICNLTQHISQSTSQVIWNKCLSSIASENFSESVLRTWQQPKALLKWECLFRRCLHDVSLSLGYH